MAVEILADNGKDYNCQQCDDRLRKERGCEDKGIVPFWIEEKPYYRCPLKLITPLSYEYIKAFNFYQKSILPQGRGWLEENDKFLEAMVVIDNAQARLSEERIKKK